MSKIVQNYQIVVDCGRLWLIVHNCAQLCNLVPAGKIVKLPRQIVSVLIRNHDSNYWPILTHF